VRAVKATRPPQAISWPEPSLSKLYCMTWTFARSIYWYALTTIRREFVSPISAFSWEGLRVKRNHAFLFNGASNQHKLKLLGSARPTFAGTPTTHAARLSYSMADHFTPKRAAIDAGQVLFHRGREQ
jgi:hypothetical protein